MAEIKEKNQMKSSWDSNLWKKIADFFEHNIWAISGNKIIEGYFEIDNPFFRGFYIFNSENVGSFYILAIFSDHIDKNRMDFTLKVILKALKKEGWGKITTPLTEVMDQMEFFGSRGLIPYLAFLKQNKILIICKEFKRNNYHNADYISLLQTKSTN